MFWLWLTMLLFLAALAEIILGLYHLAVPCLLLTAFYFSCLLPWQKATLPVLLAAALLDSSLGRTFPACGLASLLMLVASNTWKRFGAWHSWLSLLLPGASLALILMAVALIQHKIVLGSFWLSSPGIVVFQALSAIVVLPPLWQIFEFGARRLSLRRLETFSPYPQANDDWAVEKIDENE